MRWKHWRPAAIAVILARGPVIAVSLAVTAVISALFGIWLSIAGASTSHVAAAQMAFTPDRFIDAIGELGPDGITELIRLTITLDFLYPVAYAAAIGGVWARLAGPSAWAGRALPLAMAFGAAATDWLENLLHLGAAAQMVNGSRPSMLYVLPGSLMAAIKWALLVAALFMAARAAVARRGTAALLAIPLALLAGSLAAVAVAAI